MNIDSETNSPARHGRWLVLVAVAFFAIACVRFASSCRSQGGAEVD